MSRAPRTSGDVTRQLITAALAQGWTVDSRNGHLCFKSPDKTQSPVFTGSTPSDRRGPKNLRADLRRAGLDV
jgi:hypothetical protein